MKLSKFEYDTFDELQDRMGYRFKNPDLLYEAMTHSSYANEYRGATPISCNERLEFLGDSVLSLITSNHIYKKFPKEAEGSLSRLRAFVVRDTALADYARNLEVGKALLLGHGEDTRNPPLKTLLKRWWVPFSLTEATVPPRPSFFPSSAIRWKPPFPKAKQGTIRPFCNRSFSSAEATVWNTFWFPKAGPTTIRPTKWKQD